MTLKYHHLKLINYVSMAAVFLIGVFLYKTSYDVRFLKSDHERMEAELATVMQAMHVLKAEWSYLDSPAHLKKLSNKVLPHKPARVMQLASWKSLDVAKIGPHTVLAYKQPQKRRAV
ncbi:MAG: hypothetical protein CMM87_05040 [Rickettsiales bacterium]|nr:hypothetical protein [Rickettsiales bacterium]|tara:strand:- start:22469 stop:22819 length:351 start_codon:yes stop_codon:yes gene_type:complete